MSYLIIGTPWIQLKEREVLFVRVCREMLYSAVK